MLGETELRVLQALDAPRTRQDVAERCGYEPKTVTEAVATLERLDLVTRERTERTTTIHPVEARCIEAYQSLVKTNPHVDFPDLLTKTMLVLLYYLDAEEWKRVSILVEKSGLPRSTVYRHLNTLGNRALVMKNHGRYRLSDDFADLHTFARELYHHVHRTRVKRETTGGTLVWESHDEFLVRTDEPVEEDHYLRTGLDAFEEYGLQFLTTSEYYYFYSERRETLSPADLACHLLLIENDARHRKYALLLVAATETPVEGVHVTAESYGIEETMDPLLEFLDSRGEETSTETPPWDEMQSLAADYGVAL